MMYCSGCIDRRGRVGVIEMSAKRATNRIPCAALAGPDWYVIEKARSAKQAAAQKQASQHPLMADHAAMMKACREMMAQPK